MSTVERAYTLARSGQVQNIEILKARLKADGCRAVDALLSARSIRGHLEAICAARFTPTNDDATDDANDTAETPETSSKAL